MGLRREGRGARGKKRECEEGKGVGGKKGEWEGI